MSDNDRQELVDMLEARVRDKVVAAAVGWHAARRRTESVQAELDEWIADGPDDDYVDDLRTTAASAGRIEEWQADHLADVIDVALRSGP
ncbi:MAG: hypothetical protein OXG41_13545 [Acidimicrobiaceae bacterium]|nr:hypothetical protein [Acidimicrobiaceae bacterium]MYE65815.1 hypothetical protein [Acidimicrobiaceae bacterium]